MASEISQNEKQRMFRRGQKLLDKGKKLAVQKKPDKAIETLNTAKKIFRQIEAPLMEAKVFDELGKIRYGLGQWETSIEMYKFSMGYYEEFQQIAQKAKIMVEIGRVMVHLKWYDEALDYAQRAHDTTEQLNLKHISLQSVFLLGSIYQLKHDYQSAVFYFNLAEDYLRYVPNMQLSFQIKENLGYVYHKLGKFQQSNEKFLEIIQSEQAHSRYPSLQKSLAIMGKNFFILGQKKKAYSYFTDSNQIARKLYEQRKSPANLLDNLLLVAKHFNLLGNISQAEEMCEEAIIIAEEKNIKDYLATGLALMARIMATRPQISDSKNQEIKNYLGEAQTLATSLKDEDLMIKIKLVNAFKLKQQGFEQAVINSLNDIVKKHEALNTALHLELKGEVYKQLGIMFHKLRRNEEALESFQVAIDSFTEQQNYGHLAESYYNAACVACLIHLADETINYLLRATEINPKYKKIALGDQDFRSIRSSQAFKDITQL